MHHQSIIYYFFSIQYLDVPFTSKEEEEEEKTREICYLHSIQQLNMHIYDIRGLLLRLSSFFIHK